MRRCLRCILLFCAVGIAAAAMLSGLFVWFVADWLARADPPRKADYIVVLAGAPERLLYAADLYREQYAPRVLLSRPARDVRESLYARFNVQLPREEETSTRILLALGVPAERIDYFGSGSKSTVEELETLRTLYQAAPTRLLVVTSPLSAHRVGTIAADLFERTQVQATVVTTP